MKSLGVLSSDQIKVLKFKRYTCNCNTIGDEPCESCKEIDKMTADSLLKTIGRSIINGFALMAKSIGGLK